MQEVGTLLLPCAGSLQPDALAGKKVNPEVGLMMDPRDEAPQGMLVARPIEYKGVQLIHSLTSFSMNNMFRGLLAGGAAYKWGGGCFGTVLIFVIVYFLLGSC